MLFRTGQKTCTFKKHAICKQAKTYPNINPAGPAPTIVTSSGAVTTLSARSSWTPFPLTTSLSSRDMFNDESDARRFMDGILVGESYGTRRQSNFSLVARIPRWIAIPAMELQSACGGEHLSMLPPLLSMVFSWEETAGPLGARTRRLEYGRASRRKLEGSTGARTELIEPRAGSSKIRFRVLTTDASLSQQPVLDHAQDVASSRVG